MYDSKKSYTVDEALSKLQKYCSYQDRCHKEVEQKLKELRMIPEAADQIIMTLIDGNYLNEERFALAFVRGKFKIKKWGRHRLTSELKQRNISKYLIILLKIFLNILMNIFKRLLKNIFENIYQTYKTYFLKRKL